MLMAVSRARFTFSVHTLAARPNFVLLAKAMASLGVRNVRTVRTGPNICSEKKNNQTANWLKNFEINTYFFLYTNGDRLDLGDEGRGVEQPPGGHTGTRLIHFGPLQFGLLDEFVD